MEVVAAFLLLIARSNRFLPVFVVFSPKKTYPRYFSKKITFGAQRGICEQYNFKRNEKIKFKYVQFKTRWSCCRIMV